MEKFDFHRQYFDQTLLHPLAAAILAAMGLTILFVHRKYAVWPFIIIACFITQAQRINIATLDFTFLRVMVVFAFLRLAIKDEFKGFKWQRLDTAVVAFMGVRLLWSIIKRSS